MNFTPYHHYLIQEAFTDIVEHGGEGEIRIVVHGGRVSFIQPGPYLRITAQLYAECASCSGSIPCEVCPMLGGQKGHP